MIHGNDNIEESKDLQSSVNNEAAVERTHDEIAATVNQEAETTQFSHLFPAHLYVKRRTAGQEIDHSEDVGAAPSENNQTQLIETKTLPLLFDNESKV